MIAQLPGFEQLSAAPICGEDFCDSCGDCLHCYDGDWCPNGGHVWVVYTEQVDEWRSKHPDADVAERSQQAMRVLCGRWHRVTERSQQQCLQTINHQGLCDGETNP